MAVILITHVSTDPAWRLPVLAMPPAGSPGDYPAAWWPACVGWFSRYTTTASFLCIVRDVRHCCLSKTDHSSLGVIGDTCSPTPDLVMAPSLLDELDSIVSKCKNGAFTHHVYPAALFQEVIKINLIRLRAAKMSSPDVIQDFTTAAFKILNRIQAFSPEKWAESKPSAHADWILIGNIYQSAVALYCILSLQSLSVLPRTADLRKTCNLTASLLQLLLSEATPSPRLKTFFLWPLVVLGVEAAHSGNDVRIFVLRNLEELSRSVGTYIPLTGKDVLERFWASGSTDWDSCFDKPYAFVMQPSVDVSRLR